MNNRFKSILAEAHLDVMEHDQPLDTTHLADRFAVLLVKRCIEVLDGVDGSIHHEQALLEYFGIKEEDGKHS